MAFFNFSLNPVKAGFQDLLCARMASRLNVAACIVMPGVLYCGWPLLLADMEVVYIWLVDDNLFFAT